MSNAAVVPAPAPRCRNGSFMAWLGGLTLAAIALACFATLPFSLGKAAAPSAASDPHPASPLRRFEATNSELAPLPPFWAAHRPDEQERLTRLDLLGGSQPKPFLGTDRLGRSVLVRCLLGGAISL